MSSYIFIIEIFSKRFLVFSDKDSVGESRDSSYAPANNECVDVVGSLVGVDGLQVHDVSDDVVLIADAISS